MTAPKKKDDAQEGKACCKWIDFRDGFMAAWPSWFKASPTDEQWAAAVRDWKRSNTGYEAAHIAMCKVRDDGRKALEPKLVHLGGRNYCYESSALARFSAPTSPTPAQEGKT